MADHAPVHNDQLRRALAQLKVASGSAVATGAVLAHHREWQVTGTGRGQKTVYCVVEKSLMTAAVFVQSSQEVERVQKLAAFVVGNLLKTRNQLGMELALAFEEAEIEQVQAALEEANLVRHKMSPDDILRFSNHLIESLPHVEWDAEALADALFCRLNDVNKTLAAKPSVIQKSTSEKALRE